MGQGLRLVPPDVLPDLGKTFPRLRLPAHFPKIVDRPMIVIVRPAQIIPGKMDKPQLERRIGHVRLQVQSSQESRDRFRLLPAAHQEPPPLHPGLGVLPDQFRGEKFIVRVVPVSSAIDSIVFQQRVGRDDR